MVQRIIKLFLFQKSCYMGISIGFFWEVSQFRIIVGMRNYRERFLFRGRSFWQLVFFKGGRGLFDWSALFSVCLCLLVRGVYSEWFQYQIKDCFRWFLGVFWFCFYNFKKLCSNFFIVGEFSQFLGVWAQKVGQLGRR